MDDTNSSDFPSSWLFGYLYPECGSSSLYLYVILDMIRILKIINKYIRVIINILVRVLLGIMYFILLFPFAIFIRLFTDFLEIKHKSPSWIACHKIEDVEAFLAKQ